MLSNSIGITDCCDARLVTPVRNIFGIEPEEETILQKIGPVVW